MNRHENSASTENPAHDRLLDLDYLLTSLHETGGDTEQVEVKSGAGGFPENLIFTLCALSNLPDGGVIIIGLDESADFAPVDIKKPQEIKQGIGNLARSTVPPARIQVVDKRIAGKPVIMARVFECDRSNKPCKLSLSGKAYRRSYDGDFEMTDLEVQGFLSGRDIPHYDRLPVPDTSMDDLDSDILASWLKNVRTGDESRLGKIADDKEILHKKGVLTDEGLLTTAGLLTLGAYPQQFFPQLCIRAAVVPGGDPQRTRARNLTSIDGPIPVMLEKALHWVRKNIGYSIESDGFGNVRDVFDYPLDSVREIIANSLVHRDLAPWSHGQAIELRISHSQLILSNPGGLYGISVKRLGREHLTSSRNPVLMKICEDLYLPGEPVRVVESLASGIPHVVRELAETGMQPPVFFDEGIRFTVRLQNRNATSSKKQPQRAMKPEVATTDKYPVPGTSAYSVATNLSVGNFMTVKEISDSTGLTPSQVRKALESLENRYHLIENIGTQGQTGKYRLLTGFSG